MMKGRIRELLLESIRRSQDKGELPIIEVPFTFSVERSSQEEFGDYATNVAFLLASRTGKKPAEVAEVLVKNLPPCKELREVQVAGQGYVNFFVDEAFWFSRVREACVLTEGYGRSEKRQKRALVEFVSANPTGPLHIGHGRIAAFGDALARLLEWVGYDVEREYYVNDVGTQIELLGKSVFARYMELKGKEYPFPEDGYRGEYIYEVAKELERRYGDRLLAMSEVEALKVSQDVAEEVIMGWIKEELSAFGVGFDRYVYERDLYREGKVERVLGALREKGFIYQKEGAVWFRSTAFGDEKDRVVVRASGVTTYFASDIAYHLDKFKRGYDLILDIWGADHHGYVKRLEAAIKALGYDAERLKVILVQLVNLLRGGKRVSMSTRAGEFAALREVIEEVGPDATRFFMLLRRAESPLDFDLELAKTQSEENPVYYVQYAHARISSIFKKAQERGIEIPNLANIDLSPLKSPEERSLAKMIGIFPEILEEAAQNFEPHPLTVYLLSLAKAFHGYYNRHRVLGAEEGLLQARMALVYAVKTVIKNGLCILGVKAPEEM